MEEITLASIIDDDEEDNPRSIRKNVKFFFETNNDLQNIQIVEQRG